MLASSDLQGGCCWFHSSLDNQEGPDPSTTQKTTIKTNKNGYGFKDLGLNVDFLCIPVPTSTSLFIM